jgi:hypothetical protein
MKRRGEDNGTCTFREFHQVLVFTWIRGEI